MANDDQINFCRCDDPNTGFLCQSYPCKFESKDRYGRDMTFYTAEQYVQFRKAERFGDIDIKEQIYKLPGDPKRCAYLGDRVKGYSDYEWQHSLKYQIAYDSCYLKFSVGWEDLEEKLLNTGESYLAEEDTSREIPRRDVTENLVGKALMAVRRRILQEKRTSGSVVGETGNKEVRPEGKTDE